MPLYISPPPANPFTRLLMALLGLLALVGAFMLGLFALAIMVGLGLLVGLGVWLRMAWIRRRLRKEGYEMPLHEQPVTREKADVIEAEYTVVRRHHDS